MQNYAEYQKTMLREEISKEAKKSQKLTRIPS